MLRFFKRLQALVFVLLVCGTQTMAYAGNLPESFTIQYSLSKDSIKAGEVTRTLRNVGDNTYIFESNSKTTGFISLFIKDRIVERSTWKYVHNRPQPLEYYYDRSGGRKKRHAKLDFDWENSKVINNINNDPWQMEIPADTQDKLLYQLTLMLDLMENKKNLVYAVADGGKLKNYKFTILSEEVIKTSLGSFATVKIQRNNDKRATTIWCAVNYNYLPVQIVQREKDGKLKMVIQKIQGIQKTTAKK